MPDCGTYAALETLSYAELEDGYWYQGLEVYCTDVPPCGSTGEFGGTITTTFFVRVVAGRVPIPNNWTSYSYLLRRGNDANVGDMYIGFQFEDKNLQYIRYEYIQTAEMLSANETFDSASLIEEPVYTEAEIPTMRFVSIRGQSTGLGEQNPNTPYTWDAFADFTFYGCPVEGLYVPRVVTIVG